MTSSMTELRSDPAAPVRAVRLGSRDAVFDHRPDGTVYIRSPHQLAPYPVKLTERLEYWAGKAPDRTFKFQIGNHGSASIVRVFSAENVPGT